MRKGNERTLVVITHPAHFATNCITIEQMSRGKTQWTEDWTDVENSILPWNIQKRSVAKRIYSVKESELDYKTLYCVVVVVVVVGFNCVLLKGSQIILQKLGSWMRPVPPLESAILLTRANGILICHSWNCCLKVSEEPMLVLSLTYKWSFLFFFLSLLWETMNG